MNPSRQTLHLIRSRLLTAFTVASELHPEYEFTKPILAGLAMAQDHCEQALAGTMATCDGREPLSNAETILFENLQRHLKLPDDLFDALTHEQKFSAARVINKQGAIHHPVSTSCDMLGISFGHIFIGIEKDGYAHS